MSDHLTTAQVARAISDSPMIPGSACEWQVRRLFEDGTLPEPPKFGGKRVISATTIPSIVAAMQERGQRKYALLDETASPAWQAREACS